jgi:hypothetical protein
MTRRQKIALLFLLAAVFVALQLRVLLFDDDSSGTLSILRGKGAPLVVAGPTAAERLAGILQLVGEIPLTGTRDIFKRVAEQAPSEGQRAVARRKEVRPRQETEKARATEPPPELLSPVPAPPPLPPPPPTLPPPEDPMVQVKKELAAYRFVGYFRKTAGDQVLFLMKGTDVFLVKKGDILVRGVVVAEVKEREIVLQVGADRKARAALRDNSPLSIF